MDLKTYIAKRRAVPAPTYRELCGRCRKALRTCYCHMLSPFASPVPFVILQHETEFHNPIATARMAHLSMTNSQLIVGSEFAACPLVNALLAAPDERHVMLYPSVDAMPLEDLLAEEHGKCGRLPVFWVLDAKWAQVPKMLRLSPNLRQIPQVKFAPERRSEFCLRRQPRAACVSTIEAIFLVIDRVLRQQNSTAQDHHALLTVFRHLVRQQLAFVSSEESPRHSAAKERRALRRQRRLNLESTVGDLA